MPKLSQIVSIVALVFAVSTSVLFLCDAGQRYAGTLRAKAASVAHQELAPAYLHGSDGAPRARFARNEAIFVHEHYRKLQSCHVTISNIFSKDHTVFRGDSYLSWVREDDYELSEAVPLPSDIVVPGQYLFTRKTVSFCGGENVYYTTNFSLPIEITVPTDQAKR